MRASSAIELQERERVRIGFDLHDGPAQTMSAALLQLRMLDGAEGVELAEGLAELRDTLSVAIEEIYGLIENLGGRDSNDLDLASRIRACATRFTERFGIPVDLDVDGDCGAMSPSLQIATFRIVQEALSNAGRHSDASHLTIRMSLSEDEVSCEVADDGRGFSVDDAGAPRRRREPFGLHGMMERARMLDGECVVDSAPGIGTRVRMRIPVWRG